MKFYRALSHSFVRLLGRACVLLPIAAGALPQAGQDRSGPAASAQVQMRVVPGLNEPLVATGPTTVEENLALDKAIALFRKPSMAAADYPETAKPFADFLAKRPNSAWRTALMTNLGLGYYRAGYFTLAIDALDDAWKSGKAATSAQAKPLADRAVGELAQMYARLGDATRLAPLLDEIKDRGVGGSATELVTGAIEGLWTFRNDPGLAYLCGPMALKNLLVALKAKPDDIASMSRARSGTNGFTLAQVSHLANSVGLKHELVFRAPGTPIPVPSVVNWKVNHYAAIVGEENGRFHVQDPTFASGDYWITRAAIDSQASGYFLVPSGAGPSDSWRVATAAETERVYGKGRTTTSSPGPTKLKDPKAHPDPNCSEGMCVANAHLMLGSINLNDTPVGYKPQKGPSAMIRLTYNLREAFQPATFSFFNVGPKWTLNVLSWVMDDPANPGQNVVRYEAGGGAIDHRIGYFYDFQTGAFNPEHQGGAVLWRIPATGPASSYELRNRDGSKLIYAKPDGATAGVRRMFLTKIVDPAGNALTLQYDAQLRLTSMLDATGRITTFGYTGSSYQVTSITDPFGRRATLRYGTDGYLASITDVIGMTSSFTYAPRQGLITSMTTPYGTTRFTSGIDPGANRRFLTITDPLGLTERVEVAHQAPGTTASDAAVPSGFSAANNFLQYRNTFYWDKHAYAVAPNGYSQARRTQWLHFTETETGPIIASTKEPLESRVWYAYPNQSHPGAYQSYYQGSIDTPTETARVLDDGSTQISRQTVGPVGKPTSTIDSVGRVTEFSYDAAGVDLLAVKKTIAGTPQLVGQYTYNSQHLPLTYVDAAGQLTRYTYNAAGQLTSFMDALGRSTSYTYDSYGRLVVATNANGMPQRTLSYDAYDRVLTRTDSEGYTLAYSYDALDRMTGVTYPDGTTSHYAYNKLDMVAKTDRLGRVTRYNYDANRRLVSEIDPLGRVTAYAYYGTGVLKRLTDPSGHVTSWDIDVQSRPTAKRYADGRTETYTYESSTSRLKSATDALGQTKAYSYTPDNRIAGISYTNAGQPTANVSLVYDSSLPRLAAMNDGIGSTTFAYHPVGAPGALKLASEDGPYGNDTVSYQYDALGRVTTRMIGATNETFQYDSLGRISRNINELGSFDMTYLGQTGQITSQASATVGTQWTYLNNAGDRRLNEIKNTGLARSFSYATTPENRIMGSTERVGTTPVQAWTYSYDDSDRLTSAVPVVGTGSSYAYDAADNITSINARTATYNSLNQVTTFNGVGYVYDANGNLKDDGVQTYQWDAENRLIGIGYKAQPGQATTFRYDGLGRRLAIIDSNGGAVNETRYQWCSQTLCQARSASDNVAKRYYAQGAAIPQSGILLYYSRDQLGSIRDLLTTQNGAKVASYDYDSYGSQTAAIGSTPADFGYAGMFKHSQSGLYLTKYRAYSAESARWLSRDVIAESGGTNLYNYVGGDPISRVDPDGDDWRKWCQLLVIAFKLKDPFCFIADPSECDPKHHMTDSEEKRKAKERREKEQKERKPQTHENRWLPEPLQPWQIIAAGLAAIAYAAADTVTTVIAGPVVVVIPSPVIPNTMQ